MDTKIVLIYDGGNWHGLKRFKEKIVNFLVLILLQDFFFESEVLSHRSRLMITSQQDYIFREIQFYRVEKYQNFY
jgi:hypothetical protein